ncbi:MAG TPA: hypothetical protein VIV15_03975 [Anaerolineales bacterium]
MRRYAFLGYVLLGIYLIIVGLGMLGLALPSFFTIIAGICALVAGVIFLINR